MVYSKWETIDGFRDSLKLVKYNGKEKLSKSGIPLDGDESNIYLDTRNVHSIVIGSKGTGRHEGIILPMVDSILSSGESAFICDQSNDTYETTRDMFIKEGYKVFYFDLDRGVDSNCWNPFDLALQYYKEEEFDLCQDTINDIAYSIFSENVSNADPFWVMSVMNYFKGLVLYAIKNKKDVNLDIIYNLNEEASKDPKGLLEKVEANSPEYVFLSSILNMPKDTFLSVISVFNMKFNLLFVKDKIKNMLNNNDISLKDVFNYKTIIYVKGGEKVYSESLLPLFISQLYSIKTDKSKFNIIITDFNNYKPINDFVKIMGCSIDKGICFTLFIPGFNSLTSIYGLEGRYCIESNCKNIIYLLSRDSETLEYISKLCGDKDKDNELISVNELKTLDELESVIICTRVLPYRTKLLGYHSFK